MVGGLSDNNKPGDLSEDLCLIWFKEAPNHTPESRSTYVSGQGGGVSFRIEFNGAE